MNLSETINSKSTVEPSTIKLDDKSKVKIKKPKIKDKNKTKIKSKSKSKTKSESITGIPIKLSSLLRTIKHIFRGSGKYREWLLGSFVEENPIEKQRQMRYISEQFGSIYISEKNKTTHSNSRQLTHQKKLILVNLYICWLHDPVTNMGTKYWGITGTDMWSIVDYIPKKFADKQQKNKQVNDTTSEYSRQYLLDGDDCDEIVRISFELRMLQVYVSKFEQLSRPILDPSSMVDSLDDSRTDFNVPEDTSLDVLSLVKPSIEEESDKKCKTYKILEEYDKKMKTCLNRLVLDKNYRNNQPISSSLPCFFEHLIFLDPTPSRSGISDFKNVLKEMFQSSTKIFGLMNVNHHTLFWVKHRNTWYLCDPLNTKLNLGKKHTDMCMHLIIDLVIELKASIPIDWEFLSRSYSEQERVGGDCFLGAFARILQLGVSGYTPLCDVAKFFKHINCPLEEWAPILARNIIQCNTKL